MFTSNFFKFLLGFAILIAIGALIMTFSNSSGSSQSLPAAPQQVQGQ